MAKLPGRSSDRPSQQTARDSGVRTGAELPECNVTAAPRKRPAPSRPRAALPRLALILAAILASVPGCFRQFGTGGTGEMVVPADRLRRIDPLDLGAYNRPELPASRPSVQPETGPASGPTTGP